MTRLRGSRPIVIVCIALLAFAVVVPTAASLVPGILTPLWVVVPAVVATIVRRRAVRCDEQPVSLLSVLLSRAPPAQRFLA